MADDGVEDWKTGDPVPVGSSGESEEEAYDEYGDDERSGESVENATGNDVKKAAAECGPEACHTALSAGDAHRGRLQRWAESWDQVGGIVRVTLAQDNHHNGLE